jgi:carbon-monoxide dehydrogenase medium subunit
MTGDDRFYRAASLSDAVAALAERGRAGAPLAGATWIMRAPIRQEALAASYVAIGAIEDLRRVDILDHAVGIGACVTHAALAESLARVPECRALVLAANGAANPSIRNIATLGGNLCADGFAAADLVPALLCLDAEVELEGPGGGERIAMDRFLGLRNTVEPGRLVRRILVPRTRQHSIHMRLPLRKAGDYPVAIVSMAVSFDAGGRVDAARVAVGSVEPVAKRWTRLEAALIGQTLDPDRAADKAALCAADFAARDGVEAPGWYRLQVLPALVRRAATALRAQA